MFKDRSGQSLVEVLIAISIGALIIGAAVVAISLTLKSDVKNESAAFALPLARDLLDKTRSIAEGAWTNLYSQPKLTDLYIVSDNSLKLITGAEGLVGDDIQDGLVGYWKFDEATGVTAYDSANNNKGTLTNTPTRVSNCKVARCIDFDGTNDYVVTSILPALGTAFTLSAWVNPDTLAPASYNIIVSRGLPYIGFTSQKPIFSFQDSGSIQRNAVSASNATTGQWIHLLGVHDGTSGKLYVNGVLAATAVNTPLSVTSTSWDIGAHKAPNYYLDGKLDDVRIYNRALSAGEISQLYKSKIYNRALTVENVSRDAGGNIVTTGGTDDPSTQKVTATINFEEGAPIQITEYFTRNKNDVTRITDWSNQGSYSSQNGVDINTPGQIKLFQ